MKTPIVCIALLLFLLSANVSAQIVSVDAPQADASSVVLTLYWPQPAQATAELDRQEWVIRCTQPLNYEAFAQVMPRLQKWVISAFFGYDSMVFTLAPGATVQATNTAGKVQLRLQSTQVTAPPRDDSAQAVTGDEHAARRLQFLKATLLWSFGQTWQASELLEQMRQVDPKNSDILNAQGVVEQRQGRWRAAAEALDRANTLQGIENRRDLPPRGTEHAPRVLAEFAHDEQSGQVTREGLRLNGHAFLAAGVRLSFGYEFAQLQAPTGSLLAAALPSGELTDHLGILGLRYDAPSGSWLGLRLSGTSNQVGLGVHAELWDRFGATQLSATAAETRWDLPSLAALNATRDGVGVARSVRAWNSLGRALAGDITLQMAGYLERWTSQRDPSTVSDMLLSGGVQYATWWTKPQIFFGYAVQHLQPLDDAPAPSAPRHELSTIIVKSHFHLLSGGARYLLWRWLSVSGFGGYGLSYFSDNTAQFGGELAWQPPSGLRGTVRYQFGVSPESYGNATSTLRIGVGATF